jgi:hypothetical protein
MAIAFKKMTYILDFKDIGKLVTKIESRSKSRSMTIAFKKDGQHGPHI